MTTNIEMLDWDDTELIDTWDLALQEYNKYYSLAAQEKRKQREATSPVEINPKREMRQAQSYAELEPQSYAELEPQGLATKSKHKKVQKKKKNKQSIPIEKIQQVLMPNCTCGVKTSKYMEECLDTYYKGYKDGTAAVAIAGSGGSIHDVVPSQSNPWYLCGFDTAKIE
jgi:hypothetical protein